MSDMGTWEQVSFMDKNLWVLQRETEKISHAKQKEPDLGDFWQIYARGVAKLSLETS